MAPSQPYADCQEFVSDLEAISQSLHQNGSARIARGRLRILKRAAQVFGFHLAPLDMRQHSGVHEQVVAELFLLGRAPRGLRPSAGGRAAALAARGARRPETAALRRS